MANGVHPLGCYGCGVLFIAVCIFLSFSYRTLCLVITSFAQISWCSSLCLLDGHPLLWDSEYQLFAWTSSRHVSIVGWGRDWWLSPYVPPPPHQSHVQGNKNGKTKRNFPVRFQDITWFPTMLCFSLHLKEEAFDFLEPDTIANLVKKYSQFINFPIYLWTSKVNTSIK